MSNAIIVEWKKIRNKSYFKFSLLSICIIISFFVLKDVLINKRIRELGVENWLTSINTIIMFLVIPVISGILYTFMVNSEYSEKTIINYITALVNRKVFLVSKTTIWLACHLLMGLIVCIIAYFGSLILFPTSEIFIRFYEFGMFFIRSSILSFISLTLLVPISILQKESYIPSIIATIVIAAVGISAVQLNGIIPFAFPWTAAFILSQSIQVPSDLITMGYIAVILSFFIFYSLGLRLVNKQDL